jgi:hypothetical protein
VGVALADTVAAICADKGSRSHKHEEHVTAGKVRYSCCGGNTGLN